jgi:replicative DNA helicase
MKLDNDLTDDMVLLPPHNLDAEQAILGGILSNPERITAVIGTLKPEHFYNTVNENAYRAMLDCFDAQLPLEPIAINDFLKQNGKLDAVGGAGYVFDLMLYSSASAPVLDEISLRYWTKRIIDLAQRRETIKACRLIEQNAQDISEKTYLQDAENLLFTLAESFPDQTSTSINPIDEAVLQLEAEASSPNGVTGLRTGFPTLDRVTHGLQPWQLITVSARPGGGKSAFALNVACHVVMEEHRPVLYISLEMTAAELMKRAIKAKAGNAAAMDALKAAAMAWQPYRSDLIIEDAAGQTLSAIQASILKAKKQRPDLALVVVDHIGLIMPEAKSKNQNRAYEIQEITSCLKTLAKTIQVPILQLAQMNRAVEGRIDKKPMLSDLRDSGSIEMDSDIVLFTNIERYEDRSPSGNASITIAKQRDGVQMDISLLFVPHLTLFKEK